jgi:hypothetical protein
LFQKTAGQAGAHSAKRNAFQKRLRTPAALRPLELANPREINRDRDAGRAKEGARILFPSGCRP